MLWMKSEDYESIVNYCKKVFPYEACGLLGGIKSGRDKQVRKIYCLTNIDKSKKHYSMSPKEQFAAIRDMRMQGCELLGSFHSHPDEPPVFSKKDEQLAYDRSLSYGILSLMDIEQPVFHVFVYNYNKNTWQEEAVSFLIQS